MAIKRRGRKGSVRRATANVTATPTVSPMTRQATIMWQDYMKQASPQGQITKGVGAGMSVSPGQTVGKFFTTGAGRMMDYGTGMARTITQAPGAAMKWAGGMMPKPQPAGSVRPGFISAPKQASLSVPATYESTKPLNKTISNTSVAGSLSVRGSLQKAKKTKRKSRKKSRK